MKHDASQSDVHRKQDREDRSAVRAELEHRESDKLHTLKMINLWSAASFVLDVIGFAVMAFIIHIGLKNYEALLRIAEALKE